MHKLNCDRNNTLVFKDMNINLNFDKNAFPLVDYLHLLQNNAFISLIDKPTRVTPTSQTIIDRVLTNDNESTIEPGVFSYKISGHNATYCIIHNPCIKSLKLKNSYIFRNIKSLNGDKFHNDLAVNIFPLCKKFMQFSKNDITHQFNEIITAITLVIETPPPYKKQLELRNGFSENLGWQMDSWYQLNVNKNFTEPII